MIAVMAVGIMASSRDENLDGTPCAMKVACTVWLGGKVGDSIKYLPIEIVDSSDTAAAQKCIRR